MKIKYNNIEVITNGIKHIMIDKDLKQKDLCVKTGLSKQAISNLLNNRTENITLDTLNKLCSALDCILYIDIQDSTDNTDASL